MSFLADTNILGELVRPAPNPGVTAWAGQVAHLSVSVITVEEIHHGLARKPNLRVQRWLEHYLEAHCDRLPVTEEIARRAGQLRGQHAAAGRVRSQADMLIAATAVVHGLTLVSRNTADFEGCGVPVLDPFQ